MEETVARKYLGLKNELNERQRSKESGTLRYYHCRRGNRHGSPTATIFGHVLQNPKEGQVIDFYIAPLLRKKMFDMLILFLGKVRSG